MSQYSLRYPLTSWAKTVTASNGQIGICRIAASSSHHTLLASCFDVLGRELLNDLVTLSCAQRQQWIHFIGQHQSPESGLFLDPLLTQSDLSEGGHNWQYLTWQFTFFSLAALDALGAKASHPLHMITKLLDPDEIRGWLVKREWTNPWLESNNVMFLENFLIYEWERTGDKVYETAVRTILDWLDKHQNPETGYWDLGRGASLRNAMAGAFHFYFFYFYLGQPVNYPERIIDSTLKLQHTDGLFDPRGGGGACLDLDAVDILVKFSMLTDYRAQDVKIALSRAFKAILNGQNPDGGFCEAKRPPLWQKSLKRQVAEWIGLDRLLNRPWRGRPLEYLNYSSWDKMRYRVDESDLWSTWFRTLTLALISSRYPGEFIDDINWQFRRTPTLGWHDVDQMQRIREQFYI